MNKNHLTLPASLAQPTMPCRKSSLLFDICNQSPVSNNLVDSFEIKPTTAIDECDYSEIKKK